MNISEEKPVAQINYSDSGQGKTIVFLHGFLESLEIWSNLEEQLSPHYRVICVDLPGHGNSSVIAEEHSMELMATEVHNILEILGIENIILVGHSMGGYVSMAFAEKYPRMLKGLIMFHSQAGADSEQARINRDRTIEFVKNDHLGFIKTFIPDLFTPSNREKYKKEIDWVTAIAMKTTKEAVIAGLLGMKNRPDRTSVLGILKCPILFIAGKLDTRVPLDLVTQQLAMSKHAYMKVLNDAAHMGYIEAKTESTKLIKDFIKSINF